MNEVRQKILISAKELFIQQGYKKTTIRQIVDKSGVLIGSIYYFFKNKEEIFQSLVLGIFDACDELVSDHFGEKESPVFQYAFMCAVELQAVEMDERISEIYYEGYSSNTILDKLVSHAAEKSQIRFQTYNPNFTYEDYYVRTLAIKGVMRNYIANRYLKQNIPLETRIDNFLDMSLHAFNIEQKEIEEIKQRIADMNKEIIDMTILLGSESFS
ncbi:TetR/AcrR family transcriptional regulator [Clostridium estertheticum]|uniref:TetR/AcrR family transcriptional regulator n=1 Tax=Clostridium estertheticum TaxID=238834 RepID=UPI001C7CC4C9|nr:TetR/AcrR family transcriptional regulator [Clostridium estertheticum]MBX4269623.1 TetR/AcrR family transcriptional regulator [Clostridium estertheticum]WLC79501.1 TetR/AcrR family transcriptional regulator [Clostridium estertheticum]